MNHFASVCRSRGNKGLHSLAEELQDHDNEEDLWIGTVAASGAQNSWNAQVNIGKQTTKMKVDSGAEANVIPQSIWRQMKDQPPLMKSKVKLKAFGGSIVKHLGITNLDFVVGDRRVTHPAYVTEEETCPIVSLKTSLALGLISPGQNKEFVEVSSMEEKRMTAESIRSDFGDVFEGLGCYADKYHIHLKK